jgi:hypothetical protein
LPNQIGKPQQQRDQAAEPRVHRPQLPASAPHQQYAKKCRKKQDGNSGLVVQADPGEQTCEEPELGSIVA